MYHYTESGLDNVYLNGGYNELEIDGEIAVSIHDLAGLHKVIGQNVIRKSPMLTANEIRFLRKEMDLTQSSFAALISVSEATIRGWESGRTAVPGPEDKLIRGVYVEHFDGKNGLSQIIEDIARLNREIAEHERRINFEENADGIWQVAEAKAA